jgi:hypothetical protein
MSDRGQPGEEEEEEEEEVLEVRAPVDDDMLGL